MSEHLQYLSWPGDLNTFVFCFLPSEHLEVTVAAPPERSPSPQPEDSSSAAAVQPSQRSAVELHTQVGQPGMWVRTAGAQK